MSLGLDHSYHIPKSVESKWNILRMCVESRDSNHISLADNLAFHAVKRGQRIMKDERFRSRGAAHSARDMIPDSDEQRRAGRTLPGFDVIRWNSAFEPFASVPFVISAIYWLPPPSPRGMSVMPMGNTTIRLSLFRAPCWVCVHLPSTHELYCASNASQLTLAVLLLVDIFITARTSMGARVVYGCIEPRFVFHFVFAWHIPHTLSVHQTTCNPLPNLLITQAFVLRRWRSTRFFTLDDYIRSRW